MTEEALLWWLRHWTCLSCQHKHFGEPSALCEWRWCPQCGSSSRRDVELTHIDNSKEGEMDQWKKGEEARRMLERDVPPDAQVIGSPPASSSGDELRFGDRLRAMAKLSFITPLHLHSLADSIDADAAVLREFTQEEMKGEKELVLAYKQNAIKQDLAEIASRPRIICLCGSTRFIEQFAIKTWELEREGFIVLGCTLLPASYCPVPDHFGEYTGTKAQCDELHLRKIDMADEVLVLNVGGYIGESTSREIAYATASGKPVRYLEPNKQR